MTVSQGTQLLLSILSKVMINQGYTDEQADRIREIGESVYDDHGAMGMKEVYRGVHSKLPALGSTLSKIWDGVGDWAH